jgi:general secretion pathway protein F
MQTFRYRALNRTGERTRGEIDAADRTAAIAHLQAIGLVPLATDAVRPNAVRDLLRRDLFGGRRLSSKALAELMQQLSTLTGAGVSVEQALAIIARNRGATPSRQAADDLLRRLRGGATLSGAMRSDAGNFPPIAIGMVRAGEAAGNLDVALARLADFLRRSDEARQSIKSALVYPALLVLTAFLSVIVILTVVVPQLEPLFVSSGANLPLTTRIVVAASDGLRAWWWTIPLILGAATLALRRVFADPSIRLRRDAAILRAPVIGPAAQRAQAARFARTLGTLAGGNVPLPMALALAQAVLSNAWMIEAIGRVTAEVREGGGLAEPLARAGVLPALSIDFIRIGEATGRLDHMLVKLADLFDAEVQRTIERSLALLVPVITILLGMFVAVIISSVMAAILSVNDLAI